MLVDLRNPSALRIDPSPKVTTRAVLEEWSRLGWSQRDFILIWSDCEDLDRRYYKNYVWGIHAMMFRTRMVDIYDLEELLPDPGDALDELARRFNLGDYLVIHHLYQRYDAALSELEKFVALFKEVFPAPTHKLVHGIPVPIAVSSTAPSPDC